MLQFYEDYFELTIHEIFLLIILIKLNEILNTGIGVWSNIF